MLWKNTLISAKIISGICETEKSGYSFMSPCIRAQSMQKKFVRKPSSSPIPSIFMLLLLLDGLMTPSMNRFFFTITHKRIKNMHDTSSGV